MSIIYDPKKLINKMAPKAKIKKLMSSELKVNRAALSFVEDLDVVSKKEITTVTTEVLKNYRKRLKLDEIDEGAIKKDPKLLINRVQNAILLQVAVAIKEKYRGERYRWLPSDAEEPDPEHQLNYGKIFVVGEGEMPQDRYGCRCGMEILVDEKELEI